MYEVPIQTQLATAIVITDSILNFGAGELKNIECFSEIIHSINHNVKIITVKNKRPSNLLGLTLKDLRLTQAIAFLECCHN